MSSTIAAIQPAVATGTARRVGQFTVGTFAGICAAFVPRLTLMIGPTSHSTAVSVEAFPAAYVLAALAFSVLIGGVAVILEWDGARSPRDTFMAALGVPALLTGVFSTANLAGEAVRHAEKVKSLSDQRVQEEQIPVEETPQVRLAPTSGRWLAGWQVAPTVFAHELPGTPRLSPEPLQQGPDVLARYREPLYWVVLEVAETESRANRRVAELGSQYGTLKVYRVGESYFVCPVGGSFPYSEAVSKAVEVKRRSDGTLAPKLVRVG